MLLVYQLQTLHVLISCNIPRKDLHYLNDLICHNIINSHKICFLSFCNELHL